MVIIQDDYQTEKILFDNANEFVGSVKIRLDNGMELRLNQIGGKGEEQFLEINLIPGRTFHGTLKVLPRVSNVIYVGHEAN